MIAVMLIGSFFSLIFLQSSKSSQCPVAAGAVGTQVWISTTSQSGTKTTENSPSIFERVKVVQPLVTSDRTSTLEDWR